MATKRDRQSGRFSVIARWLILDDFYQTKINKRNLPHRELNGSTYFITMNVDPILDKLFKKPELASLMENALNQYHKDKYLLQAYEIMPDHLHLIIRPLGDHALAKIMHLLKGSLLLLVFLEF